ncbi:MAG: urease accessory protein UreF [Opitutae bacterium]|nr:urease accessory protein UreF [Opitutae bacterium]
MSSDPATNTEENASGGRVPPSEAAWIVGLLQAGDSFYPTGGYAHSFGLEGLVQEGVVHDRATLKAFIELSTLPALRQAELPLAVHAWKALGEADWKTVGELCVLSSALKSAREARLASDNIGRQRTELMATLRQHPLAAEFMQRAAKEGWPFSPAVAAALEGRVLGAPLPAVLAGVYYASVAALLSAAMKLLRLGQNASQSLMTELLQRAPAIIAAAEAVPREDIGWFNPWLDIAAARHEQADSRMFIS